ncbi:MAG: cadherin-like beta sandwich domain-containing protein [Chromatiales bacterium]|nr:cadherin-like beta sandwich domain-containing protein [Chromatiales bacterium]
MDDNTVVSGEQSGNIELTEGGVTTITIIVTAQDRDTTKTYEVVVERPAVGIRVRIKVFLEGPLR